MNLSLTTDDLLQADRRAIKRALMSWGTGRNHTGEQVRGSRATVVVLENADALPDILAAGLVDADSTVFVGGRDDAGPLSREPGHPRVIGYQGSAGEPGEELSIGDDFFLQIQDYATSEYMSLLGPTLIRICGSEDFAAFLADADRARSTGGFAEFSTNPAVQFADQNAYGAAAVDGPEAGGPTLRLWVDGAGSVSTSVNGTVLGTIGDPFDTIARRWREINAGSSFPSAVCLGAGIGEDERSAALADRPWLPDYLLALDAIKDLHARGQRDVRVSGFGGRRSTELAASDGHSAAQVLLWTEDANYLVDSRIGRTFRIDEPAARAVDAVLALGSVEAAGAVVDPTHLRTITSTFAAAGVVLDSRQAVGAGV
jgi:hypothetical protein